MKRRIDGKLQCTNYRATELFKTIEWYKPEMHTVAQNIAHQYKLLSTSFYMKTNCEAMYKSQRITSSNVNKYNIACKALQINTQVFPKPKRMTSFISAE